MTSGVGCEAAGSRDLSDTVLPRPDTLNMHRLCTFDSPVHAWHAAVALWRRWIVARIYHRLPDVFDMTRGFAGPRFEILICNALDAPEAELAIQEAAEEAADGAREEPGQPDLSRLDPGMQPNCPGCDRLLPLRANLGKCPSCSMAVDVVEQLVSRHGPEALIDCYGSPEMLIDEQVLAMAPIPCPACEYLLTGLAARGRCPECGQGYDKEAIVMAWLG